MVHNTLKAIHCLAFISVHRATSEAKTVFLFVWCVQQIVSFELDFYFTPLTILYTGVYMSELYVCIVRERATSYKLQADNMINSLLAMLKFMKNHFSVGISRDTSVL